MGSKGTYFMNQSYEDYPDKPTSSEQQQRPTMNENRVESSPESPTQKSNCLLIFLVFIVCITSIVVLILTALIFQKIGDECGCTGNEGSSSTSPQKIVGNSAEIKDLGNNITSLQLNLINKVESDSSDFKSHFENTSKDLAEINSTIQRKLNNIEADVSDLTVRLTALEKGIEELNSTFIEKMDILDSSISELTSNSTKTNKNLEELNNTLITKMDNINTSFTGLNSLMAEMNKDLVRLSNITGEVYAWQIQCENGGSVTLRQIDNEAAFRFVCDCTPGFEGERCETQVYALLFNGNLTDYVAIEGMPSLTAFTACLWMKTADTTKEGTPLSYAVSNEDNELLLIDYGNFVTRVGDASSDVTSVSANDGDWHHICLTWENTAGSWKLYKDGNVGASGSGLNSGHVMEGGGLLILGQDQDSLGGTFDVDQSFIGEMTGVNIWDHVVSDEEITRMSNSCGAGEGNVLKWSDFKEDNLNGTVKFIKSTC